MARESDPLVFSTDRSHQGACPTCGRRPCVCPPPEEVDPARTVLRLRLDKKGRRGKAMTLVDNLPRHPTYGTELTRRLKTHCGTGGTLKDGVVEIQGDQRDKVQAYLERLGFKVRRAGG